MREDNGNIWWHDISRKDFKVPRGFLTWNPYRNLFMAISYHGAKAFPCFLLLLFWRDKYFLFQPKVGIITQLHSHETHDEFLVIREGYHMLTASSSSASFFAWQRRARKEWLVMNRKGPWEEHGRQAKRLPDLVSFSWQKSRFLGTAQFLVFLSLGSDQF